MKNQRFASLPLVLLLAAPWLLPAAPLQARGLTVNIPWPVLIAQARRIVIARVDTIGDPQPAAVPLPAGAANTGRWRSCTVTVKEDLQRMNEDKFRRPDNEKIEFLIPAPAEGELHLMLETAPVYPVLKVNQEYLLLLQPTADDKALYLPAYFRNYLPADDPAVAKVRPLANPATWPWGNAVDGLQLLFWPEVGYAHVAPNDAEMCFLPTVAALRNVSDKTIQVNLYGGFERPLNAVAKNDKNGEQVNTQWYDNLNHQRMYDASQDNVDIAAGEILWIGPFGREPLGLKLDLPLYAGNWTMTATYTNQRIKPAPTGSPTESQLRPLWRGTLESGPVKLVVPPMPEMSG